MQERPESGIGGIKAVASGCSYGCSARKHRISYNAAADQAHGGLAGVQAGSTFKTFTLIIALKKGMRIDDGFRSVPATTPGYTSFKNCVGDNVGAPVLDGHERSGSPAFKTLAAGIWDSVNTFFMTLQERVGLLPTVQTAKSLGIKRADGTPLREFEVFTLGINEGDSVTVAADYAAIAARGTYCASMGHHRHHRPRWSHQRSSAGPREKALDSEVADVTAISHPGCSHTAP